MSKRKLSPSRPPGRRPKHGAYAITFRKEILEQYPELTRYSLDCRDGLVKDLAPAGADTLPMAKQIILDRLTAKLLTAGLLDIFMGQHGILRRDALVKKVLEAEPIVATWLSINNAILRDLEALGLERKQLEPLALTPTELADAIMADKRDLEAKAKEEALKVENRPPSTGVEPKEGQASGDGQGNAPGEQGSSIEAGGDKACPTQTSLQIQGSGGNDESN